MKKLMMALLFGGAMLAAAPFAPAVAADLGGIRPPHPITIKSLSANGSGCPPGTIDTDQDDLIVDTDDDGFPDFFSLLFSQYIAARGPGIPITDARKNCNIILVLDIPPGFSFTILSVDYRGFAELEHGVRGQQRSDYSFPLFGSGTVSAQTTLQGPFGNNYARTDMLGIGAVVWSPCGIDAPLNIRTQVRVYGQPFQAGLMTVDQAIGRVGHTYGFNWRRCNSHPRRN